MYKSPPNTSIIMMKNSPNKPYMSSNILAPSNYRIIATMKSKFKIEQITKSSIHKLTNK